MIVYRILSYYIGVIALLFAYIAGREDAPVLNLLAGFFLLAFADAHHKVLEMARLDGDHR